MITSWQRVFTDLQKVSRKDLSKSMRYLFIELITDKGSIFMNI